MSVRLPQSDNRTAVIGSTGSGKTQFSVWLLSLKDFNRRPWIIFDFKGDILLEQIGATEIRVGSVPKNPGLYICRPLPGDEYLVSDMFQKILYQENVGVYIDEGYMLPKNDRWIRACLTQGRSKHIELIICSQRPVFLDKFVFTESNFFAVFNMNFEGDRKQVTEYLGDSKKLTLLPDYHSLWYDVGGQRSAVMGPVPNAETLISTFRKRLENKPVKM